MIKILLTGFFVIVFLAAPAQELTEKKTTWFSGSFSDDTKNTTKQLSTHFILDHNKTVQWVQKNDQLTYTFTITSVTGEWEELDTAGSIDLAVTIHDLSGHILFYRNDDGLYIKMLFSQNGIPELPFTFAITNIQTHTP